MDKVPAAKQTLMKVASHRKCAVVLKSEREKKRKLKSQIGGKTNS